MLTYRPEQTMSRTRTPRRAGDRFEQLVDVMRVLRSENGCPWDREQTLESLRQFVLEEAYEVIDAIERNSLDSLREEIGDLIFEGVFLAQITADAGAFDVVDALEAVVSKLIRRHPHVFQEDGRVHDPASKARAPSAAAALARWDSTKARERAEGGRVPSVLQGVPQSLPGLLRAYKIGKRAAAAGFDWPRVTDVLEKIEEEVGELRAELTRTSADSSHADEKAEGRVEEKVEEEMGDLLFAIANLARKLGTEPEAALRRANEKFIERFQRLERRFFDRGKRVEDATLEEMEKEWQEIKGKEAGR